MPWPGISHQTVMLDPSMDQYELRFYFYIYYFFGVYMVPGGPIIQKLCKTWISNLKDDTFSP